MATAANQIGRVTQVIGAVVDVGQRVADQTRILVRELPDVGGGQDELTLERNAENRLLRVSAESSEFLRSSEVALEGEGSARVMVLHFLQLPSGTYDVIVDVKGMNGRTRERARCEVTVL